LRVTMFIIASPPSDSWDQFLGFARLLVNTKVTGDLLDFLHGSFVVTFRQVAGKLPFKLSLTTLSQNSKTPPPILRVLL
jgi:hypothetical protein